MSIAEIREFDRRLIEEIGVPSIVLMENAGREAARVIFEHVVMPQMAGNAADNHSQAGDQATRVGGTAGFVAMLCGPGNNGGDGFVIARHLLNRGVAVSVCVAADAGKLRGDARTNFAVLSKLRSSLLRVLIQPDAATLAVHLSKAAIVVDALLGTGAANPPRGQIAEYVRAANGTTARRVAIDIPTGLDGDSGEPANPCFVADLTITMVAAKQGFERDEARRYLGQVVIVDIGVGPELLPPPESTQPPN
jgi:NAD(P)H-hydrate epimerase